MMENKAGKGMSTTKFEYAVAAGLGIRLKRRYRSHGVDLSRSDLLASTRLIK
jgi:hypothetical protein